MMIALNTMVMPCGGHQKEIIPSQKKLGEKLM